MKMRKAIMRVLIAILAIVLGMGSTLSLAMEDYQGDKAVSLALSYFRYVNGSYTDGYALNTVGNEGESHHPIYQIISTANGNKTNYYCLNATAGESWLSGTIGTSATYNRSYDLNLESDLELLKNDTALPDTYRNIATSTHLKQILWILDNIYIPDSNVSPIDNLAQKQTLLAKAGIVYGDVDNVDLSGNVSQGYRYVAQTGYDYSGNVSQQGKKGYFYYDAESNYVSVELPDEMVEVAQQAALWYFTNYLENNTGNSETYNVKDQELQLLCSDGTTNTNTDQWPVLDGNSFKEETDVSGFYANVGMWRQEQASILCEYLIDAANNYASSSSSETVTGSPLKITPATTGIEEKKIGNTDCYVVGPMKIDTQKAAVYNLSDTIAVNGNTSAGAYISDVNGNRDSDQIVANHIGQDFYVTIPKSNIIGKNVKIDFDGAYKTNNKTLWISSTKTEQPIVEVDPGSKPIDLTVNATIIEEEKNEFDLSLRKAITKLTDTKGNVKLITNEAGKLATRNISYVAEDLADAGTATYNHRKDPVVVETGDIVTYSITVYNEGDIDGYAGTIVDKLPAELKIKGAATGKYTSGNISYTYEYDIATNTITFTNVSKNILAAYTGGSTLSSETIEVECEVTGVQSAKTNTYLTNIAYISKEHNSETDTDVITDRDSAITNNPSANQTTTGDKYTGYHGGDNNNGDNNKNVYNDGTNNDDYFPGREDDDDFEVVVIKPKQFDLALQKYISSVYSKGTTRPGRKEPTIDTSKLATGVAKTATYTQDKTPIKVKQGDYVTYTFNVYNEGSIDGYVNKVTDNIPTGLQFVYQKQPADGKTLIACDSKGISKEIEVDEATYNLVSNNNDCWSIDSNNGTLITDKYNGEDTISITCDVASYLGGTNKLLKAYDNSKDTNYDGSNLDSTSVTVVLRVEAENSSGIVIRNEAAITEAEDSNGNKQDTGSLTDRDSQINKWPGKDGEKAYQDDEDYDRIILGRVDLALTKFITAVSEDIKIEDGEYLTKDKTSKNAGSSTNPYTRATKVDTTKLRDDADCHDATYTMVKAPLTVPENSYVLYNIRVYNEGETDVYAGEVTDYLPNYLDYVDCEFNTSYGWSVGADGKTIKTSYLSAEQGIKNLLKSFNKTTDDGAGSGLDYRDLQILCRVNSQTPEETKLINTAEITKYQDEDGKDLPEDIDSEPENLEEKNKEQRIEDDDDFEVVIIKKKKVDLALTKFITAVSDDTKIEDGEYLTKDTTSKDAGSSTNPYTRATKVDTTKLRDDENCHDATYTMVKDPLTVPAKSYVLYNIRVYNEGETDVYAGEVTDHLPDYLDYVECEFNKAFEWEVGTDGKTVKSKYLSHTNGTDKMLKAFNKITDDGEGSGLDYKDLPILCRINDKAPTNTNIVNVAEITKYEDGKGEDITEDIDSVPNNVDKKNEDDDDYEVVLIKTFDLSLLKYVTTVYVTEDGKTTTTQTGNTGDDKTDTIPKVEIDRKKLDSTVVKFGYTIKVTNEGDIAGYAKEITDYVPQGLKFYSEDNEGWKDEGNNVISTRLLENTLLQPGESAEVIVILRWINGSNNLGLKTNIAEISEDYNDEGVLDRDSTPDNKKEGEDDIDDAKVLLSIKTGLSDNIVMYITIGAVILIVLGTGIITIRKFVL